MHFSPLFYMIFHGNSICAACKKKKHGVSFICMGLKTMQISVTIEIWFFLFLIMFIICNRIHWDEAHEKRKKFHWSWPATAAGHSMPYVWNISFGFLFFSLAFSCHAFMCVCVRNIFHSNGVSSDTSINGSMTDVFGITSCYCTVWLSLSHYQSLGRSLSTWSGFNQSLSLPAQRFTIPSMHAYMCARIHSICC